MMNDLNRDVLDMLHQQNDDLDTVQALLYEVLATQIGEPSQLLKKQLEPSLLKLSHQRTLRLAEGLRKHSPAEFVSEYVAMNHTRMNQVMELQLRILSEQTGRSVLALRNEFVD